MACKLLDITMRAHIVLPEELLNEVDRIAGKRKRSRFVEDAVREKLSRAALAAALQETAGALNSMDYPEWATPEQVSAWVRAGRQRDDARLEGKLRTHRF